jgi:putative redox protein
MLGRKSHASIVRKIRAVARHRHGYTHHVRARDHDITIDEMPEIGGADEGPSPQELLAASLASCTAVTMKMYAERKGWDLDGLEVHCEYAPAERGSPTRFGMVLRLPAHLAPEQVERLRVIAAKCPVHRTLEGEVAFDERVELA